MLSLPVFCISSSEYSHILVSRYLASVWWAYAIPGLALIGLGFADIRFLFLAAIYIFLVIPAFAAFSLITYGLIPESRLSIIPHRLDIDEEGLTFSFPNQENPESIVQTQRILWSEIARINPTAKRLILCLKNGRLRFIVIPYTAFSSPEQLMQFMDIARHGSVSVE